MVPAFAMFNKQKWTLKSNLHWFSGYFAVDFVVLLDYYVVVSRVWERSGRA